MSNAILILNAGSSSLKFTVFPAAGSAGKRLLYGKAEGIGSEPRFSLCDSDGKMLEKKELSDRGEGGHDEALAAALESCRQHAGGHPLVAVGHRVVHGGEKFASPVRIDEGVLKELEALVPLAPLHQPHNLAPIRAVQRLAPQLPQVACFDTAFHRTQPEVAQRFAIPRRFTERGVRRYGFHGLSYEYIASVLPAHDPKAAAGRTVVAHLGNGASMCAMLNGRSIATTMGFTPADGLVMGTRTGAIDPGVLLYLMRQEGMGADQLEHLIYHESGLLGVSGISGDMRALLSSNDPHAAEAVDLFVYRAARELGSLAAALGGLDAIVFTGGIGENSPAIRERICRASEWLGVEVDANGSGPRGRAASSKVAVWVIPTNEELMIAEHARQVLGQR